MKVLALAAVVGLAGATALGRPTVAPAAVHGCAIEGWSGDRDPNGLNVRAGPSLRATVVGRLPAFVIGREEDYGVGFAITGGRGGWLRIRDARDAWGPDGAASRRTYRGEGWVHGSAVRAAVQSGVGRAGPSPRAPVLVDLGHRWLSERGQVLAITDCSGKWGKIRYRLPAAPGRFPRTGEAWFNAICGEQRTTCDLAESTS